MKHIKIIRDAIHAARLTRQCYLFAIKKNKNEPYNGRSKTTHEEWQYCADKELTTIQVLEWVLDLEPTKEEAFTKRSGPGKAIHVGAGINVLLNNLKDNNHGC